MKQGTNTFIKRAAPTITKSVRKMSEQATKEADKSPEVASSTEVTAGSLISSRLGLATLIKNKDGSWKGSQAAAQKVIDYSTQQEQGWSNKGRSEKFYDYTALLGLPGAFGAYQMWKLTTEQREEADRGLDKVYKEYDSLNDEMRDFRHDKNILKGFTPKSHEEFKEYKGMYQGLKKQGKELINSHPYLTKQVDRPIKYNGFYKTIELHSNRNKHMQREFEMTEMLQRSFKSDAPEHADTYIKKLDGKLASLIESYNKLKKEEAENPSTITKKEDNDSYPQNKKSRYDTSKHYKEDILEVLDTKLLIETNNNKFQDAKDDIVLLFHSKDEKKPILNFDEMPDFILNRVASYAMRCQANNEDFPFNENMEEQKRGIKTDTGKERFERNAQIAEKLLYKAIQKSKAGSNNKDLSHALLATLYLREAEVAKRNGDELSEKAAHSKALKHTDESLQTNSNNALYKTIQARASYLRGERSSAEAQIKDALTEDKSHTYAKLVHADLLVNKKEYEKAKQEISNLPELKESYNISKSEALDKPLATTNHIIGYVTHKTIANVLKNSGSSYTEKVENRKRADVHDVLADRYDALSGVAQASKTAKEHELSNRSWIK